MYESNEEKDQRQASQRMMFVLRQIARWSLRLVLCALLLMTLLLLGVRVSFTLLPLFHERVVIYLNEQLDTSFSARVLTSEWHGITPAISVRGLSLKGHEADREAILIDRMDLELNVTASILNLTPIISNLEVNAVDVLLSGDAEGNWSLYGIRQQERHSSGKEFDLQKNLEWLSKQEYIDISNVRVEFLPHGQKPAVFNTRYLSLTEDAGFKQLFWGMELGGGQVELMATGQGTRRWNMNWSGQIMASDVNLFPACELLKGCDRFLSGGQLNGSSEWRFQTGNWELDTSLDISDIRYSLASGESAPAAIHSSIYLFGYSQGNQITDWQATLADTRLTSGSASLLLPEVSGQGNYQGELVIDLQLPVLDLTSMKLLADSSGLVPGGAAELVDTLNPTGTLRDIEFLYYPHRDPLADGSIVTSAYLDNVSVDAWEGAPSGGNVSGFLQMNTLSGYFDLDTSDFQLGFPELFKETWFFDSASARLEWDVVDDIYRLKSDTLAMQGDEGLLNGKMVLDVPFGSRSDQPLFLSVDVDVREGNARHAKKYIPVGVLDKDLNEWLEASIHDARINEGRFSIAGPLDDDAKGELLWSLLLNVEDGTFEYDPDWPLLTDLKAKVFVNNDEVQVEAEQVRTYDTLMTNARAALKLDDEMILHLQGQIQGTGQDVIRILSETPLDEVLEGEARNWSMTGKVAGDLTLEIPVEHVDDTYARVSAETENATFRTASPDILLTELQGEILFDSVTGLSSPSLTGRFLGDSFNATIASDLSRGEWQNLHFDWNGHTSVYNLHRWLELDFLSLMEGSTDYQGKLIIPFYAGRVAELLVSSSLRGVAIDLPAPIGISTDEENPLYLHLNAHSDHNDLMVQLQKVGRTQILFDQDFGMKSAVVALGDEGSLPQQEPDLIRVSGSIQKLDLEPWVNQLGGQPPAESELDLLNQIEIKDVQIEKLVYQESHLEDLKLSLVTGPHYKEVTINSEPVDGQLLIPNRPSLPYSLAMNRVHLPDLFGDDDDESDDDDDPLNNFNPKEIPSAIIRIESLKMGDQDYGHLSFIVQPVPEGKRISDIKASMGGMDYEGSMDWLYRNHQHETHYQGRLRGSRIDAFQEAIGVTPMVSAKDSRIDASLNWQGSPLGVDMASLEGDVRLRLRNGSLKSLEGGAGALRVFGLFNMEALLRRLRLDFSDLYASGISFDELRGALHFDKGFITFDEALSITGPSSNFKLDGMISTTDEVMDLSLVVTLPFSANLPILSVLLGTAPQVAGIFYIADKLVGRQVDQLASIRYRINGSFDDPSVTLDQLFSSKTKKPEVKK